MKRKVLAGVVSSVVLYAVPIWEGVIKIKKYKNMLLSTQRRMLLRVTCSYRTVSLEALAVISGTPPIDLQTEERGRLYRMDCPTEADKKAARMETLRRWRQRWADVVQVAQWTKVLIPDPNRWLECRWKKVDYYMTQFLSGHGCFGTFTHRIGKNPDSRCKYCGEEVDDPVHTIFHCVRWRDERVALAAEISGINPTEFLNWMMMEDVNWEKGHTLIISILRQKKIEERAA